MAILKSSKRELKKAQRRRLHNLFWKNKVKKTYKEFFDLIKERKVAEAKEKLPFLQKVIDKAKKEKVLKKNKASRLKSKAFLALNAIEKEKKG
jgi:small subunit ribosomal protein S20